MGRVSAALRGADLAPIVMELKAGGVTSLNGLANALTERGVLATRESSMWSPSQVFWLLAAMALTAAG